MGEVSGAPFSQGDRTLKKLIIVFCNAIKPIVRPVVQAWFTGFIYIMGFAGYAFYGILWWIRFMQTHTKALIIGTSFFLLLIIAGGGAFFLLMPMGPPGHIVEMRVTPGATLHSIARSLQQQKVIRWSTALSLWMKFRGTEKRIQAGRFDFLENEGTLAAAKKLLIARPFEVTVFIPEGMTIDQTAKIFLKSELKIDTALFLSICSNREILKKHGIPGPTLEGYLFPDTYRFPENDSAGDVINRIVDRFKKNYESLDTAQAGQFGFIMHQFVTLASIIEKEARIESERPRISAVFHNRLKKGIPLGADPTVRYIFKNFSGPIYVSQLKSNSPYNTRIFSGLPPGPICSPGKASLQAAMTPAASKELYFVAKWDGSGAHDFSTNYRDHDKKKEQIRQLNNFRIARMKHAKK
jgi:UPF0755 protein